MMAWKEIKTYKELCELNKDTWIVVVTLYQSGRPFNETVYKPNNKLFKNREKYS